MNNALKLGKLFGIPLRLHYTWFIIFALVTVSLSALYFPEFYPLWQPWLYWTVGIATSLLFFTSVVAHELTHSLVSTFYGVPVRSITLFIFGGVARISREADRPRAELVMAASGPLSSLALAGFFALIFWFSHTRSEPIAALAGWLLRINILLAFFNLIPGFPLDGGRVFRSLVWQVTGNYKRATRYATLLGRGIAYLFILGGIFIAFFFQVWLEGLWLAFIGWFLENAASASYRQTMLRESLRGATAAEVMTQECPLVPPGLTVRELVQEYVLPSGRRCFFITEGGILRGVITLHDIRAVPQRLWDTTLVEGAMTPAHQLQIAHPQEEAVNLLDRMEQEDINQVPVVSQGRVVGLVARDHLLRFMRTRSELGMER